MSHQFRQQAPKPAGLGGDISGNGRLLIDLKQRRPVSLTLDARCHLWHTDPLGSTQDTLMDVEWRSGR